MSPNLNTTLKCKILTYIASVLNIQYSISIYNISTDILSCDWVYKLNGLHDSVVSTLLVFRHNSSREIKKSDLYLHVPPLNTSYGQLLDQAKFWSPNIPFKINFSLKLHARLRLASLKLRASFKWFENPD